MIVNLKKSSLNEQDLNLTSFRSICTNVDPTLIMDQCNFKAKYLQNGEEN